MMQTKQNGKKTKFQAKFWVLNFFFVSFTSTSQRCKKGPVHSQLLPFWSLTAHI